MPNANEYLRGLARRIASLYCNLPQTKAILLAGSAAEGLSDYYSDLDLMIYYDTLPSEEELAQTRLQAGGSERAWVSGKREEGAFAEAYHLDGIECQFAHMTIEAWERDVAQVVEHLDVASVNQKALEGIGYGVPLFGETLIRKWKDRVAQYSDELAEAMVIHYLRFSPIWAIQDRLIHRDATLWRYESMVQNAYNLIGVLAGLNHLYYTPFQFKRMRKFVGRMNFTPRNFADRLESMFSEDPGTAARTMEELVEETVSLVEQHMPQIETNRARRQLGHRTPPWKPFRSKDVQAG